MRHVSLREFRTRGTKVLEGYGKREPVLLAGRDGPAYFLVPVFGDVSVEDRELRRAMAKASLRAGRLPAANPPLSDEEIDREIDAVRTARWKQMRPKHR